MVDNPNALTLASSGKSKVHSKSEARHRFACTSHGLIMYVLNAYVSRPGVIAAGGGGAWKYRHKYIQWYIFYQYSKYNIFKYWIN